MYFVDKISKILYYVKQQNVFVFILSYSRFRTYQISLTKNQEILFTFLDNSFEIIGGVPEEIVTDNMKTVMDEARTNINLDFPSVGATENVILASVFAKRRDNFS